MNSRISSGSKGKVVVEDGTDKFGHQLPKSVAPVQEFVVLPTAIVQRRHEMALLLGSG